MCGTDISMRSYYKTNANNKNQPIHNDKKLREAMFGESKFLFYDFVSLQ